MASENNYRQENGIPPIPQRTTKNNGIQVEKIASAALEDGLNLIEIKDPKLKGMLNDAIPEASQVVAEKLSQTKLGKMAQPVLKSSEVIKAVIPHDLASGEPADANMPNDVSSTVARTDNYLNFASYSMPTSAGSLAGYACAAVGLGNLIVGQYYMSTISSQLTEVNSSISHVQNFLDNAFKGRVVSLIAHVKQISDYQTEILVNDELRSSKILQIEQLDHECTQLLGQVVFTIDGYTALKDKKFSEYENMIHEIDKWLVYQRALQEIMYRIAELRYTLHLGTADRNFCTSLISTFDDQVERMIHNIKEWHTEYIRRLEIDTEKLTRKRDNDAEKAVAGIFNMVQRTEWNYCKIKPETAKLIKTQINCLRSLKDMDTSALYEQDVELIIIDGKFYYHSPLTDKTSIKTPQDGVQNASESINKTDSIEISENNKTDCQSSVTEENRVAETPQGMPKIPSFIKGKSAGSPSLPSFKRYSSTGSSPEQYASVDSRRSEGSESDDEWGSVKSEWDSIKDEFKEIKQEFHEDFADTKSEWDEVKNEWNEVKNEFGEGWNELKDVFKQEKDFFVNTLLGRQLSQEEYEDELKEEKPAKKKKWKLF